MGVHGVLDKKLALCGLIFGYVGAYLEVTEFAFN